MKFLSALPVRILTVQASLIPLITNSSNNSSIILSSQQETLLPFKTQLSPSLRKRNLLTSFKQMFTSKIDETSDDTNITTTESKNELAQASPNNAPETNFDSETASQNSKDDRHLEQSINNMASLQEENDDDDYEILYYEEDDDQQEELQDESIDIYNEGYLDALKDYGILFPDSERIEQMTDAELQNRKVALDKSEIPSSERQPTGKQYSNNISGPNSNTKADSDYSTSEPHNDTDNDTIPFSHFQPSYAQKIPMRSWGSNRSFKKSFPCLVIVLMIGTSLGWSM